jgi:hypothetical protein
MYIPCEASSWTLLQQNRKLSSQISLQNQLFCLCRLPAVLFNWVNLIRNTTNIQEINFDIIYIAFRCFTAPASSLTFYYIFISYRFTVGSPHSGTNFMAPILILVYSIILGHLTVTITFITYTFCTMGTNRSSMIVLCTITTWYMIAIIIIPTLQQL